MTDEEFAYRTDRPVEELRKELEDLAAGWTVRADHTLSLDSPSVPPAALIALQAERPADPHLCSLLWLSLAPNDSLRSWPKVQNLRPSMRMESRASG